MPGAWFVPPPPPPAEYQPAVWNGQPGGGAVPVGVILPNYEGAPLPGSVNGTANEYGKIAGGKLECPVVGDRRALAYGTVRLIGRRLYQEDNDTASANFATGIGDGPVQGFTKFYCNGIDVTSTTGFAFTSYLGATPQSGDAWLTAAFPGETLDGVAWFRSFVQITGTIPPGGWRNLIPGDATAIEWGADLQGLKLYDPRTGLTVWSNNPALVMWDLLVRVGRFDSALLDPVTFSAAANACDVMVGSPSAKRFTFDGSFTQEASLAQMIDAVRVTCNGEIYMEDGLYKLWVDVEQPGAAVLALDDRTNFEHVSYEWVDAAEQPTRVIIEYPNKDVGYKLDRKIVDNPLLAGGTVDLKVATFRVEGCVDEVHAGRIGTFLVNQPTTALRVTGDASFAGAILSRGSKVTVTTTEGLAASPFLVSDVNRKEGGLRALNLRQYDAAVYGDAALSGTLPPYTGPSDLPPGYSPSYIPVPPVASGINFGAGGYTGEVYLKCYHGPVERYGASRWSAVGYTSFTAGAVNDGALGTAALVWNGSAGTQTLTLDLGVGVTAQFVRVDIVTTVTAGGGPAIQYSDNGSSWTTMSRSRLEIAAPVSAGAGTNRGLILVGGTAAGYALPGFHRYWRLSQSNIAETWLEVQFVPEMTDLTVQTGLAGVRLTNGYYSDSPLYSEIQVFGGQDGALTVDMTPILVRSQVGSSVDTLVTQDSAIDGVSRFGVRSLYAYKHHWFAAFAPSALGTAGTHVAMQNVATTPSAQPGSFAVAGNGRAAAFGRTGGTAAFTLPATDGAAGDPVTTDGAGNFVFGTYGAKPLAATVTNGEAGAIVIGAPVYLFSGGTVKKAKADAAATADVLGLVASTSIASSGSGLVWLSGKVTATTTQWDAVTGGSGGLTAGAWYYLDPATAGKLTSTAPTTVGQLVIVVGQALSTTELNLRIAPAILL